MWMYLIRIKRKHQIEIETQTFGNLSSQEFENEIKALVDEFKNS